METTIGTCETLVSNMASQQQMNDIYNYEEFCHRDEYEPPDDDNDDKDDGDYEW